MSLVMTELRDDVLLTPDPSFNPNVFSEDEDDEKGLPIGLEPHCHPPGAIPIAPMTPKNLRQRSRFLGTGDPSSAFIRARAQTSRNASFVEENLPSTSRMPPSRAPGFSDPRCFRNEPSGRLPPHRLLNSPPGYPMKTFHPNIDLQEQQQRCRRHRQYRMERLLSPPTEIPSFESLQRRSLRSRSEERSERLHPLRNQSFLNAQSLSLQAQFDLQASSSSNQPSVSPNDAPFTYQAEIDRIVKKLDEMIELKSPLARPESIEDEASYTDCNLNDVISFCESYRTDSESLNRHRRLRKTPEKNETCFLNQPQPKMSDKVNIAGAGSVAGGPMSRSCSVGFLDDVDRGMVPCQLSLILLKSDAPKRLFLVRKKPTRKPKASHSLDSNGFFALRKSDDEKTSKDAKSKEMKTIPENRANPNKPLELDPKSKKLRPELPLQAKNLSLAHQELDSIEPASPPYPFSPMDIQRCTMARIEQARSQPASPMMSKKKRNQSASPIRKHILNSPLLRRRRKSKTESSDDDVGQSGDEAFTNKGHYKDLETFQKAQLMQKLKRGKVGDGHTPRVRELVMHNKAPMWNENSQVYQLDFGGRVTQESAKNFQIEFNGKQVMQFGRIDGNAYTLDFQYPFSVLQAFAVALANVTQRLK